MLLHENCDHAVIMLVLFLKIIQESSIVPGTDQKLNNSRMNQELTLIKANSFFKK